MGGDPADVRAWASEPKRCTWEPDGTPTGLGLLRGDRKSRAHAVNNRGVVVGGSVNAHNETHTVLWHPDGTLTQLNSTTAHPSPS